MAATNHERVNKAPELLRAGLPAVVRRLLYSQTLLDGHADAQPLYRQPWGSFTGGRGCRSLLSN